MHMRLLHEKNLEMDQEYHTVKQTNQKLEKDVAAMQTPQGMEVLLRNKGFIKLNEQSIPLPAR